MSDIIVREGGGGGERRGLTWPTSKVDLRSPRACTFEVRIRLQPDNLNLRTTNGHTMYFITM